VNDDAIADGKPHQQGKKQERYNTHEGVIIAKCKDYEAAWKDPNYERTKAM
jgi:hypothetical protein